MKKIYILLFISLLFEIIYCAVIAGSAAENETRQQETEGKKNCICNGPSCICCIDFDVSFINLGGPGCVRMNYSSQDQSIDLNVSYGESLIQNETLKGLNPRAVCLNLLSTFAQICATFSNGLHRTDDGLKGCLQFEPTLLGEAQIEFPVACFSMTSEGIRAFEHPAEVPETLDESLEEEEGNSTLTDPEIIDGIDADDIISVVNESANQGIAILSSWLGLTASENQTSTTTPASVTQVE